MLTRRAALMGGLGLWLAPGIALAAQPTRAGSGLLPAERRALWRGELVRRPRQFRKRNRDYIGGVSYQLVKAPAEEVIRVLNNVESLPLALPNTQEARLLEITDEGRIIQLVQGKGPIRARFAVRLVYTHRDGTFRFWLDPRRPHDLQDVWGYFRVSKVSESQCLVTLGVALSLQPGLFKALFESKIQRAVLKTPIHLRRFMERQQDAVALR